MLAPSLGAASGLGWVSKNRPSTPKATAARASGSTISRLPPVAAPNPPGSWTLWVASENDRGAEGLHLRDGPHVVDQSAVAEKGASLA